MAKPGIKQTNSATGKLWKNTRKGFKHELVCVLVDRGFSFREADKTVDAIFSSIKDALLRRESVTVEGFGRWSVKERRGSRRRWRFGKVITLRPYTISFQVDSDALSRAFYQSWEPHPSWLGRCSKTKRKRRRLVVSLEQREQRRRDQLRTRYTKLIVKFVQDHLITDDWPLFWTLRQTSWFSGPASEIPKDEIHATNIDEAQKVIDHTKPMERAVRWPNGTIDGMQWYARWSQRLKVERDVWREAERWAADVTVRRCRL